jgi:hypothetical protein
MTYRVILSSTIIFVADDRMLIASKKNENSTIELLIVKC